MTLLRHLRHENVIAVVDIMAPPAAQAAKFADVYLVYELMDTDLHQIIRSPQPLSDDHVQYFIYQARPDLGSMARAWQEIMVRVKMLSPIQLRPMHALPICPCAFITFSLRH